MRIELTRRRVPDPSALPVVVPAEVVVLVDVVASLSLFAEVVPLTSIR
jgi:hypothetical protein